VAATEKPVLGERLEDPFAGRLIETEQAARLRNRQNQAGHFAELRGDAADDGGAANRIAAFAPLQGHGERPTFDRV
jgi:hypothetical protein